MNEPAAQNPSRVLKRMAKIDFQLADGIGPNENRRPQG
jgi:hypothetical protein